VAVIIVALAIAGVFAIAAVVIGREVKRLSLRPPQKSFDFEEAVAYVCDHVGLEVASILSPDDVRKILDWHLEYFRLRGVASNGSRPQTEGPVVVSGAETVDFVLMRSEASGTAYTPEQVHAVLDAQMRYLEEIGAVGRVADPDE